MNFKLSNEKKGVLALVLFFLILLVYATVNKHSPATKVVTYSAAGTHVVVDSARRFKTTSRLEDYPDVMIVFHFKTPPPDTYIRSLTDFKTSFAVKYKAYISDITKDTTSSGLYYMACDFQQTAYSKEIFAEFASGVDHITGSENIEAINFE